MFVRFKRLIVKSWFFALILSLLPFTNALAGGGVQWWSTDFGGDDIAFGLAIQSNGKILTVGRTSTATDSNFALARYNTDGFLDPTFNSGGQRITTFGGNDTAYDVAVQPNGRIVVVGETCKGARCSVAMARYLPGGRLDATFSGDGKVVTDIGGRNNGAFAVALQPDGKIVLVGYAFNGSNYDFVFYRYRADGRLDTTFSGDGMAIGSFAPGRSDFGRNVVIQSDGKIVGVGRTVDSTGSNFAIARLNADGTLDRTFSSDGLVVTNFGGDDIASAVALQPDGKIVVAGRRNQADFFSFAVARYNANGSLDTTFHGTGKNVLSIEPGVSSFGYNVIVQPNGKIVLAGFSGGAGVEDLALARLNPNGSLDITFNGDGKMTVNHCAGGSEGSYALARQPSDGRYVLAGWTNCISSPGDFLVTRISP